MRTFAGGLEISLNMHQKQYSEELQLNGQVWEDRLNYVLGAYYFKEEGDLHDMVIFRGVKLCLWHTGVPRSW